MNKEIMSRVNAFYLEIETESIKLGIIEQHSEVMVILGYNHPKEYNDFFEAIADGWRPKTLNYGDRLAVYNTVYAVISAIRKIKIDLDSKILAGKHVEDATIDNLIRTGELSDILIEALTTEYTGKWFDKSNIPKDWVSLQDYGTNFTRSCSGVSSTKSKEVFAVPKPIEKFVKDILKS